MVFSTFAQKYKLMRHLYLLMLLFPLALFSQSIKIKKDILLFDKTEVAILKELGGDEYEFSTLNGTKQFTVKYLGLSEGTTVLYQWLTVKSADGSKTSEIPYEVLQTSFSATKIIVRLLSEKYGLIDMKGINQQKLQEFFDTPRENLSEKYTKAVVVAKEEAKVAQEQYA